MFTSLAKKNILIGVTGSIAIYKSLEIIRLFIKDGANVKVIMTKDAQKLISPITFESISSNKVLCDDSKDWSISNHIGISKWADIFLIAPITANSINKLATGIADNVLLESALASVKKPILALSANTNMITNKITKNSIRELSLMKYKIIKPREAILACKDFGIGAMEEPYQIYLKCTREILKDPYWENRDVIIASGATIEKIDDTRFISNFSTGQMGYSLALASYLKGANVNLITSAKQKSLPREISSQRAINTKDYKNKLEKQLIKKRKKKAFLIAPLAVSDYVFPKSIDGKIKKREIGDTLKLKLKQNIDLLKTLDKKKIISIGFKLEFDKKNALKSAKEAILEKKLNAICLNVFDKKNSSFGNKKISISFITKKERIKLKKNSKINVALDILKCAKKIYL